MKKKKYIFYIFVFILFLALCALFPYSHDDWAWGSKMGMERLACYFNNYNGRWLGNLLVILLTRFYLLRIVVVSTTLTLILMFANKIIDSKNDFMKYFILLLLITTPHLILRQAVVWTSGYTNYVFPTLLILIYLLFNKDVLNLKYKSHDNKLVPLLFILGFCSTLCVEHITIYSFIISIFFLVFIFIKYKKLDLHNLFYFIGCTLGSILMFSNKAYHTISAGNDGYRTISPVINALRNYFNVISKELVFNNMFLNIIISIVLVILLFKTKVISKLSKLVKDSLIFILVAFPVYVIITRMLRVSLFIKYTIYIEGLLALLYLFVIFVSLLFIFKEKKILFKLLFIYLSIAIMTAPLFIVTPIGSRCFYPMYIFFIIFISIILNELLQNVNINILNYLKKIIVFISIIWYLVFILIYGYIFKVNLSRQRYLEKHINDSVIILPKTPYDGFVWLLNPSSEEFVRRYKLYYNVDTDTEVQFIPLVEWNKLNKK